MEHSKNEMQNKQTEKVNFQKQPQAQSNRPQSQGLNKPQFPPQHQGLNKPQFQKQFPKQQAQFSQQSGPQSQGIDIESHFEQGQDLNNQRNNFQNKNQFRPKTQFQQQQQQNFNQFQNPLQSQQPPQQQLRPPISAQKNRYQQNIGDQPWQKKQSFQAKQYTNHAENEQNDGQIQKNFKRSPNQSYKNQGPPNSSYSPNQSYSPKQSYQPQEEQPRKNFRPNTFKNEQFKQQAKSQPNDPPPRVLKLKQLKYSEDDFEEPRDVDQEEDYEDYDDELSQSQYTMQQNKPFDKPNPPPRVLKLKKINYPEDNPEEQDSFLLDEDISLPPPMTKRVSKKQDIGVPPPMTKKIQKNSYDLTTGKTNLKLLLDKKKKLIKATTKKEIGVVSNKQGMVKEPTLYKALSKRQEVSPSNTPIADTPSSNNDIIRFIRPKFLQEKSSSVLIDYMCTRGDFEERKKNFKNVDGAGIGIGSFNLYELNLQREPVFELTLKRYLRNNDLDQIRKPHVILKILRHITDNLIDLDNEKEKTSEFPYQEGQKKHSLKSIFDFCLDRLRSVLDDLNRYISTEKYALSKKDIIISLEMIVRMFLHFINEIRNPHFDPESSTEQLVVKENFIYDRLTSSFNLLQTAYQQSHQRMMELVEENPETLNTKKISDLLDEVYISPNEPEFLAYCILFSLRQSGDQLNTTLRKLKDNDDKNEIRSELLLNSKEIKIALKIVNVMLGNTNNQRYFQILYDQEVDYIMGNSILISLNQIRHKILRQFLNSHKNQPESKVRLIDICDILEFSQQKNELFNFLEEYGILNMKELRKTYEFEDMLWKEAEIDNTDICETKSKRYINTQASFLNKIEEKREKNFKTNSKNFNLDEKSKKQYVNNNYVTRQYLISGNFKGPLDEKSFNYQYVKQLTNLAKFSTQDKVIGQIQYISDRLMKHQLLNLLKLLTVRKEKEINDFVLKKWRFQKLLLNALRNVEKRMETELEKIRNFCLFLTGRLGELQTKRKIDYLSFKVTILGDIKQYDMLQKLWLFFTNSEQRFTTPTGRQEKSQKLQISETEISFTYQLPKENVLNYVVQMIIDDVESINESVFYGSDIVLLCTNGDIDIDRSNTFSRFTRKIFSIKENQNYVGFEGYNLMILNNSDNEKNQERLKKLKNGKQIKNFKVFNPSANLNVNPNNDFKFLRQLSNFVTKHCLNKEYFFQMEIKQMSFYLNDIYRDIKNCPQMKEIAKGQDINSFFFFKNLLTSIFFQTFTQFRSIYQNLPYITLDVSEQKSLEQLQQTYAIISQIDVGVFFFNDLYKCLRKAIIKKKNQIFIDSIKKLFECLEITGLIKISQYDIFIPKIQKTAALINMGRGVDVKGYFFSLFILIFKEIILGVNAQNHYIICPVGFKYAFNIEEILAASTQEVELFRKCMQKQIMKIEQIQIEKTKLIEQEKRRVKPGDEEEFLFVDDKFFQQLKKRKLGEIDEPFVIYKI